ncbi:MAG: IreB family regulatory phosphoprotein [Ruminococcaceae bacterium]|nr:IreB family regulatory phosphoprotein [Oscillospiraceae bacterium]
MSNNSTEIKQILMEVYDALCEKGYDPTNQIAGYILSEDPVYITDWKNARGKISHINRDELLEALIKNYLEIK